MKKIMLFILLAAFFAAAVSAEETDYKPTILEDWSRQANVIELFFLHPGLSMGVRYEMKIDDTISAAASLNYNLEGPAHSYGLRLECYFYPQAHGLNAWFVGPFAGAYNLNSKYSGEVFFSLGAQGGYRWIFDNITLTPRVMAQYGLGIGSVKKIREGAGGFLTDIGISAGYAF